MIQSVLKIVDMSLAVLNLYRCCIIMVSQFNWPCYVLLSEEPCIWHIKIITNAWFSMEIYIWTCLDNHEFDFFDKCVSGLFYRTN